MKQKLGHVIFALWAGFALAYLAIDAGPALAQALAPAAPTGGVDFAPLAMNVISAGVTVLTIAGAIVSRFLIRFLASKVGMQDSAAEKLAADRVNDILYRAIDYAEAWSKAQVGDPNSQIRHVKIDNFFLAQAVSYAVSAMPDLIKTFGLTKEKIEAMILSRVNAIMPVPLANSGPAMTLGNLDRPDPRKTAEGVQDVKESADETKAAKVAMGAPAAPTVPERPGILPGT